MMTSNIYHFGPKDEAVNRQEIVDTLKRLLDESDDLKTFPSNFKLALEERVWEAERKTASGKVLAPVSLHEFIHERYPVGIGANYEVVENLIRSRPDVLAVWADVTKRKPGAPIGNQNAAKQDSETTVDNVHDCNVERPTGNSAAAGLRKLQKHAEEGNEAAGEELKAVVEGKKSVHAACVAAGLRKSSKVDPDVEQRAARAIAEWIVEHAGADDLAALRANLSAVRQVKSIAIELTNLVGECIMDRRYG